MTNPPYVDIHTHDCTPEEGVKKIYAYRLGSEKPVPKYPFVAGVHPWDVSGVSPDILRFLEVTRKDLLGVGEIGLDFSRKDADRKLETEWLRRQLDMGEKRHFPVVLHCVKAYNEIDTVLKDYTLKAVVFHGFTGSPELAEQLTSQGYYLSFGERAFRSPKTMEALKHISADKLFLETDDYTQVGIRTVYEKVSLILQTGVQELKERLYINYKRVFDE